MSNAAEFTPQWASPPGETIADVLSARGWTRTEFANRLGQPVDVVENLLTGSIPITVGLAQRLHNVIGASVAFWMARDLQYRLDLERIRLVEREWRKSLPVADMSRLGWLTPRLGNEGEALLDFFDVSSVAAWQWRYSEMLESVEFRTSPSFALDPAAVVAWIRQGERIAADTPCAPWNADAFKDTLKSVRRLTRVGKPERFLPKLKGAMAACGVVVAVVPAPSGCRASGATLWLSEIKALLLLSARHLTDDHFWFTVYHESGHLLLHRGTRVFIDDESTVVGTPEQAGASDPDVQEEEANAFAVDVLVTPAMQDALRHVSLTYRGVLRLAARGGIAPGIIVGQLQKMGRLGPERLNRLKRRYEWVEGQLVSRGTK